MRAVAVAVGLCSDATLRAFLAQKVSTGNVKNSRWIPWHQLRNGSHKYQDCEMSYQARMARIRWVWLWLNVSSLADELEL